MRGCDRNSLQGKIDLKGSKLLKGQILAFQDATLLPAFAHPDHLLLVGAQGFAHLSPRRLTENSVRA
ncbi:hypothetical protein GZ78_16345 [Endozoicomonas numazuensis]|uniref:Uncharacterized protein n=1 Tax=Endozoicomonas numazuensis TaxID=1137799 RepID=A0A081NFZ4_9GAMM|nr:hypothetical protein GZ78_16345 [Endozoicomonas numazuensis]